MSESFRVWLDCGNVALDREDGTDGVQLRNDSVLVPLGIGLSGEPKHIKAPELDRR